MPHFYSCSLRSCIAWLDRARDMGWCTDLLLNREHTVAMYSLRALRRIDRESIRLMATVRLQHGWIMNSPIFTQSEFPHNVPPLEQFLAGAVVSFSPFFIFVRFHKRVDSYHFNWIDATDIWHCASRAARLTRRPVAGWNSAHQFIVVHCLQLDKLKQLEVTEKHNPVYVIGPLCPMTDSKSFSDTESPWRGR